MKIVPLESSGFVTPKDYSRYVKFHVLKGKNYRVKTYLIVLGVVIAAALLLYYGLATRSKGLIIAAGAVVLALCMFIYTINVNVKRICRSNAKTVRAKQETVFGKNGFVFDLIMQNPEENEHDEIFYDELEAIYLTKHAIYVYIEKRSVIIIPKRNLKVTPFETYSFLYKYIPKGKLILCR